MDTLTIKGMKFRGFHGVHEHEKEEGNDFEVDVIVFADLSRPGHSDTIKDAIDYTVIHDAAKSVMEGTSKNLIEHLCFIIGDKIADHYSKSINFEVAVRKLHPPLSTETIFTEARMTWPR